MISLTRLLIFTRWGRYVIAAILLVVAVGIGISGLGAGDIQTKTGTLNDLRKLVDDQGNYLYSELKMDGDSATYRIKRTDFAPALDSDKFFRGGTIDIWYTTSLLNPPQIIAIQLRDENDQNAVMYVTDAYTHPDNVRNGNFVLAGIVLLLAVAAGLAGAFMPIPGQRARAALAPAMARTPRQPQPGMPPQPMPGGYGPPPGAQGMPPMQGGYGPPPGPYGPYGPYSAPPQPGQMPPQAPQQIPSWEQQIRDQQRNAGDQG
jgi:hypothetical protein